jgi:ankyrin repeat protein
LAGGFGQAGGATALQWACYKGQLEVAQWLLGLGARADTANSAGADSLQLSAKTGNATLVQLIIDAGADVHHLDRFSKTALHYAAYLGRAEACDVLLQAGAGVDAVAVVRVRACTESKNIQRSMIASRDERNIAILKQSDRRGDG